jgi:hypothetical protein
MWEFDLDKIKFGLVIKTLLALNFKTGRFLQSAI